MVQTNDCDLLRKFSEEGSQSAFAALARRHAGLLYHAALRVTGRPDLAEEAAQNALAILARKASRLQADASLAAWLHRTVCFEASKIRRRENRHSARMNHLNDPSLGSGPTHESIGLSELAPHLDEALDALSESDRQVVMWKYFDGLSFEEIAQERGGQPAAWRQRGSRALDRLRQRLARRGVVVPIVVLAAVLPGTLGQAAPPAVVASLMTVPPTLAAGLTWKTIAWHTFHTMNIKHASLVAAAVLAVLVPLGYQAVLVQRSASRVAALETTADALRSAAGLNLPRSFGRTTSGGGKPAASGTEATSSPVGGIDLREVAGVLAAGRRADPLQIMKFRAQFAALDAATLDGLLAAAETMDLPPDHELALYERLIDLLAGKDPAMAAATGLRLVAGMTGDEATRFWMNPLPNVLREWAENDPVAARGWFDQQWRAGSFEDRSLGGADLVSWMASGIFTGMMWGGDRAGGLAFFETLDEASRSMALKRFGTSNDSAADHAQIMAMAAGFSQSEHRTSALMGAVLTLGESNLPSAATFIAQAGLPAADARKLLVAAAVAPLGHGASVDVPERMNWLRQQTPIEQQPKALGYFLGEAAFTNPGEVRKSVEAERAAGASDVFLGAFIRNASRNDASLETAIGFLPQLNDPAERSRTLREIQQSQPGAARTAALRAGVSVAELDAAQTTP